MMYLLQVAFLVSFIATCAKSNQSNCDNYMNLTQSDGAICWYCNTTQSEYSCQKCDESGTFDCDLCECINEESRVNHVIIMGVVVLLLLVFYSFIYLSNHVQETKGQMEDIDMSANDNEKMEDVNTPSSKTNDANDMELSESQNLESEERP